MKKTLLWGAIASLFFVSCSKSEMAVEPIEPSEDFVAQLADVSRTELDGTAVIWNAEDELTIFTKTGHNRHYKVKTLSEDGRTATFSFVNYTGTSNGTISANYAVYPYDAQATLSGDVISTSIASEQQYNAEKVDLSYALMAAKSESNSFAFVNAGALMRFNVSKSELIPDSYTLNSIKLSSAANNIAGDVTIDLSAESRAVVASTGSKEITLTAINQEITTEAKAFYVALPAVSFADKDLTVTFTFADGEKSFALPAFDLLQGSIKTIAYTINDSDDFTGTTPDSGEDFEGETPGEETVPANNEIWYTATAKIEQASWIKDTFGANIVSNEWDETTGEGIITFDGNVTSIGGNAFSHHSKLTNVVMPNSVTVIGRSAFSDCNNLSSIIIPNSVTSIGDYAFSACHSITSVTIPDSVIYIGINTFSGCKSLKEFKGKFASADGKCLIIDGSLISFTDYGLTEYDIPNNVTVIGEGSFYSCHLTNVTIPDSVTTISKNAFSGCNSLISLKIPKNVSSIGDSAFYSCDMLTSVTLSENLTTLGNNVFAMCFELISINIPDKVTKIGAGAFYYCSNLKSITIGNSVISIGEDAFRYCGNLSSITIPKSVTSIGDYTFRECTNLKTVYCKPTTPPTVGKGIFTNNAADQKIYVPTSSVDTYKTTSNWKNFANYIEGYDFE